jgi:hypothetical protein
LSLHPCPSTAPPSPLQMLSLPSSAVVLLRLPVPQQSWCRIYSKGYSRNKSRTACPKCI